MNYLCTVEFSLRSASGELLDTTEGREPFTFRTGVGEVIPGFERTVLEMEEGEEREFTLSPEEAYGHRRQELVVTLPRSSFGDIELKKGGILYGRTPNGQTVVVTVVDFNEDMVTIDQNHPLAGEELHFRVKLLKKELV